MSAADAAFWPRSPPIIHELSGNIVLSSSPVIAQGVAPNDNFYSGLALRLRGRFLAIYKDFRHYCQSEHPKSGGLWAWSGVSDHEPVTLVALFTQEAAYGQGGSPGKAHLECVNHALKALHAWITENMLALIAIPRLATGAGEMDWTHVLPHIKMHLNELKTPIYIYTTFHKGVKAEEAAAAHA